MIKTHRNGDVSIRLTQLQLSLIEELLKKRKENGAIHSALLPVQAAMAAYQYGSAES